MDGTPGQPAPQAQKINDALTEAQANVDGLITDMQTVADLKADNEQIDKKDFRELSRLQHLSGEIESVLDLMTYAQGRLDAVRVRIQALNNG